MPESRAGNPGNIRLRKRLSSLLALLVLAVVAAVCISLGFWQLDRAAQRDALHQQIEQGRQQPPLKLSAATPASELLPWRAATIEGRWADEYTVLLQNRNLDGRPGYWVATPLLPAGSGQAAVLVLRGWLPRDMGAGAHAPNIPAEDGVFRVRGELHAHVPRIFELWDWAGGADSQLPETLPQADGTVAQVQNLDLDEYAQATSLKLLPIVLAQTSESVSLDADAANAFASPVSGINPPVAAEGSAGFSGQGLQREWPGPALDSDQNRGYALQWFGFSGIALIAALLILRSLLRRGGSDSSSKEAP